MKKYFPILSLSCFCIRPPFPFFFLQRDQDILSLKERDRKYIQIDERFQRERDLWRRERSNLISRLQESLEARKEDLLKLDELILQVKIKKKKKRRREIRRKIYILHFSYDNNFSKLQSIFRCLRDSK